jgi:hypothetical protein
VPSTVSSVLAAAGLVPQGHVSWGAKVPETAPGVYVVSLTENVTATTPTADPCPISPTAITRLLRARPELRIDGKRPTKQALTERVSAFWLADETVLYIGLAGTSLRNRVAQYYRTPLGARKPHAGGWFLKLLSDIDSLHVHYAASANPSVAESSMLGAFCSAVSAASRERLFDPGRPFPFANLEWPPGTRKQHGITGATGELTLSPDVAKETRASRPIQAASGRSKVDVDAINAHIQQQLRIRGQQEATAVEAAVWLDQASLLKDSASRPGKPLRDLLRAGVIRGQRQDTNSRWFIDLLPGG